MRPRSAPPGAAATAAAHRSAGKRQGCQGRSCVPARASATGLPHYVKSESEFLMGKGDPRTRRGKLYQGSFGKSRPKDPAKRKKKAAQAAKRGTEPHTARAGNAR